MIIGIDFDNTIIKYDDVFGRVALKKRIIQSTKLKSKNDVKEYLIAKGREDDWTELQGIVYGSHIMEAQPYGGFLNTLKALIVAGHHLKIISHKTKYPFIGEKVDLRKAAIKWLKEKEIVGEENRKISETDVFFCGTIQHKVDTIEDQKCEVFVDDLVKVLELIDPKVNRILFTSDLTVNECRKFSILRDWGGIHSFLSGK
jgi:hypothetical protein